MSRKRPPRPRRVMIVCPYNDGVDCEKDKANCKLCSWNPSALPRSTRRVLAGRLRAWLVENRVTQAYFGELVGADAGAVNRWAAGVNAPSAEYLARIAAVTGLSADYLLGLTDDKEARRG